VSRVSNIYCAIKIVLHPSLVIIYRLKTFVLFRNMGYFLSSSDIAEINKNAKMFPKIPTVIKKLNYDWKVIFSVFFDGYSGGQNNCKTHFMHYKF